MAETIAQTQTETQAPAETYKEMLDRFERERQEREDAKARIIGMAVAAMSSLFIDLKYMECEPGSYTEVQRNQALESLKRTAKNMDNEWSRVYSGDFTPFGGTILEKETENAA